MKKLKNNKESANTNNCCRRTFLRNCVAASAGAALIGSGVKLSARDNEDEFRWVAYCCQHCDTCAMYPGNCISCKSTQRGECEMKRCAIDVKKVPTCAHCDDLDDCTIIRDDLKPHAQELREEWFPTGIKNDHVKNYNFSVFPNPARDYLRILNRNNIQARYTLINTQGKIVKKGIIQSKEEDVSLSGLNQGTYILKLTNNKTIIYTRKIIKN